mmetsp:Transcript_35275/g.48965  ORF Transcript_35275/g.48965 Transcript_35275/m.48965 type:complete len:216 (-) Transcript_35275:218-865(-)
MMFVKCSRDMVKSVTYIFLGTTLRKNPEASLLFVTLTTVMRRMQFVPLMVENFMDVPSECLRPTDLVLKVLEGTETAHVEDTTTDAEDTMIVAALRHVARIAEIVALLQGAEIAHVLPLDVGIALIPHLRRVIVAMWKTIAADQSPQEDQGLQENRDHSANQSQGPQLNQGLQENQGPQLNQGLQSSRGLQDHSLHLIDPSTIWIQKIFGKFNGF